MTNLNRAGEMAQFSVLTLGSSQFFVNLASGHLHTLPPPPYILKKKMHLIGLTPILESLRSLAHAYCYILDSCGAQVLSA